MSIPRVSIVERPGIKTGLYFAWLAAGLLFAQQAGAWPDLKIVKSGPAQASPGVLGVFTEADLAADGLGNLPSDPSRKRTGGAPAFPTPRPALVRGRARHVGDPVALVVAETPQLAADAAALVHVEYEPLPAVGATADATRPGAPAVWDEVPDNVAFIWDAGPREATDRAIAAYDGPIQRARNVSPKNMNVAVIGTPTSIASLVPSVAARLRPSVSPRASSALEYGCNTITIVTTICCMYCETLPAIA